VFRRVFSNLEIVARAEKIPLEYLIESLILIGLNHMATITRARPEAIEDISPRFGFEVLSAARRQYREDMLAAERNRKKPAGRAAHRSIGKASAAATSQAEDREPPAESLDKTARSSGGRRGRSASPHALARKRRRNDGR